MDDLEWDYWMGTEVGQLGGYEFQGVILAQIGRAKMDRWGQGAVNSRGKRQTNVHESAEKEEGHEFEQAGVGGNCVSVTISGPE